MALTMTATEEAQAQKLGPLGCHLHHSISLVLKLLLFMLFAGILVAILAKDNLCRPCSWEWKFFQGNCYFLSKSQRNWHDSVTACKEEGAQLVIVESAEEQSFLQQISKSKGRTWIGLSDLNKEGVWHWVDGSPLSNSFKKYWNPGEPNSSGEEDCAEYKGDGWNDSICSHKKFWICKRSANSCPRE
ncbi:CD209 antigen-like protein 2 isoform X2 [Octodon degus]|uniref:CD209 antigen-like protein 2 isoform X2 n=1 Tax=Octodon degus TaxID=10160 RepID=A0A6P6DLF0_OCTDE|nr:CD209 antigen-like protein 2 isoform X2 [Octodon degus]